MLRLRTANDRVRRRSDELWLGKFNNRLQSKNVNGVHFFSGFYCIHDQAFLLWLSHLFGETDTCLLSSRPGGSTKVSRYDLLKLQGDNLGITQTHTICKPQQILRKFANQQPITVSAKWVINWVYLGTSSPTRVKNFNLECPIRQFQPFV